MRTLINLFVRFSGAGWIWTKTDGYKTYIAATLAILSGLLGIGTELAPLIYAHDAAGLFVLVKHLPQDQAWLTLIGGLGALGLGHKAEKAVTP